ncbi:MAG TPA: hypothetical protein VLG46_13750 [Anaerolineae bacterium]|nr:hypothetical protein [Anaerolineae bacterium]
MRTFHVTLSACIAVALVLFIVLSPSVAEPASAKSRHAGSGIIISEIEPGIGECMPDDHILVLQGYGLHEPSVQIFIYQPDMKEYVSTTILSDPNQQGLHIQVPGVDWPIGFYTLKAVNAKGQVGYFSFLTLKNDTCVDRGFGFPGIGRGDG